MEYCISIVIGVLSSLTSSALFLLLISKLRPSLIISSIISKDIDSNGKKIFRIKVINKTKRSLINIKAQLHLITPTISPGGTIIKSIEIKLKRSDPLEISKYSLKDESAGYAYRFLTYEDIDSIWDDDRHKFLRFRLFAMDSFSGFGKVFKKDFHTKRNTLIEGDFEIGDSLLVK